MKANQNSQNATVSRSGWLLLALVIFSAVGAGVTGFLMWQQDRAVPATPAVAASTGANSTGATATGSNANMAQEPSTPAASEGEDKREGAAGEEKDHQVPAEVTEGKTPPEAALAAANWFYDGEHWPLAIAQYQKAIAAGLDNPEIRSDLGNSYYYARQPQKALEQYRAAQKQNPQHERSLFNQGTLQANALKNPAAGIAVWREYLKRFPQGGSAEEARKLIAKTQAKMQKNRPRK